MNIIYWMYFQTRGFLHNEYHSSWMENPFLKIRVREIVNTNYCILTKCLKENKILLRVYPFANVRFNPFTKDIYQKYFGDCSITSQRENSSTLIMMEKVSDNNQKSTFLFCNVSRQFLSLECYYFRILFAASKTH